MRLDKSYLLTIEDEIKKIIRLHGGEVVKIDYTTNKRGDFVIKIKYKKKEKTIPELTLDEISTIFSSKKRLLMILLNEFKYTNLVRRGISTSETYKHLKLLQKYDIIKMVEGRYTLTEKGKMIRKYLFGILKGWGNGKKKRRKNRIVVRSNIGKKQ